MSGAPAYFVATGEGAEREGLAHHERIVTARGARVFFPRPKPAAIQMGGIDVDTPFARCATNACKEGTDRDGRPPFALPAGPDGERDEVMSDLFPKGSAFTHLAPFRLTSWWLVVHLASMSAVRADDSSLDGRLAPLVDSVDWSRLTTHLANAPRPNEPRVELGRSLFFSRALSGSLDTACASCHHPLLGGGDGLALSIGVDTVEPEHLGPGRRHDWRGRGASDPRADGGPNVPRNANTTFNVSLYQLRLFHDGRIERLVRTTPPPSPPLTSLLSPSLSKVTKPAQTSPGRPDRDSPGNQVLMIRTPDSLPGQADPDAGASLLAAQARFPVVSPEEMRGFSFVRDGPTATVRDHLAARLRNDGVALGELRYSSWLEAFRTALNDRTTPSEDLITYDRVAELLAEYQRSQVFVKSPWLAYVTGESNAISTAAKRGALLFFESVANGGAGCARCHLGPHFTDEGFHVLAIPQIGRGRSRKGQDLGRYPVTLREQDRFAFRTPSLLNVGVTAPYGHSGAYATLNLVVRHHLDVFQAVQNYDYAAISTALSAQSPVVYFNAKRNTEAALRRLRELRNGGSHLLPDVDLDDRQVADLVTFLESLTDPCVESPQCLAPWLPRPGEPGPSDELIHARFVAPAAAPKARSSKPGLRFTEVAGKIGLHWAPGYMPAPADKAYLQMLSGGGLAIGDYDEDGDPDIYVIRGDAAPNLLYRNNGRGMFDEVAAQAGVAAYGDGSGPVFVDIDGDGGLDLFMGGLGTQPRLFFNNRNGTFRDASAASGVTLGRSTLGSSFGDYDRDGDLDMALSLYGREPGSEREHLWHNVGGGRFVRGNREAGLHGAFPTDSRTFTTNFADIDNDGFVDLLLTGEGEASRVFLNQADTTLYDVTAPATLSGQHGAGVALGDYDNDGDLDWFVSGVWDPNGMIEGGAGAWSGSGNRLYRNDREGSFVDVTDEAGVRRGYWGSAACFADFDDDGHLDLFQTNGMGGGLVPALDPFYAEFQRDPDRLFLSNGDGTFRETAKAVGIDHRGIGRAVACFDADGDQDIDILVAYLDGPPAFYRNQHNGTGLTVRLEGPSTNIQGIGATVILRANGTSQVRQVRIANGSGAQTATAIHFGMGSATSAESLVVEWPDPKRSRTTLTGVAAETVVVKFPGFAEPEQFLATTTPPRIDRTATRLTAQSGPGSAFIDVTESAGLRYLHHHYAPERHMQVFASGSAAAGDFDGDGWVDLYVTRLDDTDLLYRNQGDGTFTDVTEQAFGPAHLRTVKTSGAAWGDVDNDGDLDLYVTSLFSRRFHLFINLGTGRFQEEAVLRGASVSGDDPHFGFSVTFGDHDADGDLDIHTTEWRMATQLSGEMSENPPPGNARLLRNDGRGHFEDVTQPAGVSMDGLPATLTHALGQSFASRFVDFDSDGYPDLAVASDHGTSRLFWNSRDGTFTDGTEAAGVGTDAYGMGSAVGDFDGDGDLDWFVTSVYRPDSVTHTGNRLYAYEGGRKFTDATDFAGVRDGAWGWGSAFFDFDNDGDLDLVMANGFNLPQQFPPPLSRAGTALTATVCGAMTDSVSSPRLVLRRELAARLRAEGS